MKLTILLTGVRRAVRLMIPLTLVCLHLQELLIYIDLCGGALAIIFAY